MSNRQFVTHVASMQASARVVVVALCSIAIACSVPDGGTPTVEPEGGLAAAGEDSPGPEGNGLPAPTDSVIESTGRVVLTLRQGGCWIIDSPVASFTPLNLPASFQVDGLEVAFKGIVTGGVSGFCAGPVGLRLEWIREAHVQP